MKYKNSSGLKQIAIVGGKKEIIPNGIVFEVDREMIHPAFERVDDATPATFNRRVAKFVKNDSVEQLQKQITAMKKDTDGIASLSESVALTETLSKQVDELSKKANDLDLRDDIAELNSTLGSMKESYDEQFKVVLKRLEILKNAIQTIELEVDQALYGEEADATKSR